MFKWDQDYNSKMLMKTQQKYKNNRKIIAISSLVIAIIVGYTATAYLKQLWPFMNATIQQSKDVPKTSSSDNNPTIKNNAPSTDSNTNVDSTKGTNQVPVSNALSLSITELLQQNGAVTYKADLSDKTMNGSCVAVYTTDGAKPVTSTTDAKSGVCGPVSLPEVGFSKLGEWTLTLRYYVNNTQVTASKAIDIH